MRRFATAVQIYVRSSKMKLPYYIKHRCMNIVIELCSVSDEPMMPVRTSVIHGGQTPSAVQT
jgi:hypothetical protein